MKRLDHPNIIKVLQTINTENVFYIIMEYASNGDLFLRFEAGPEGNGVGYRIRVEQRKQIIYVALSGNGGYKLLFTMNLSCIIRNLNLFNISQGKYLVVKVCSL